MKNKHLIIIIFLNIMISNHSISKVESFTFLNSNDYRLFIRVDSSSNFLGNWFEFDSITSSFLPTFEEYGNVNYTITDIEIPKTLSSSIFILITDVSNCFDGCVRHCAIYNEINNNYDFLNNNCGLDFNVDSQENLASFYNGSFQDIFFASNGYNADAKIYHINYLEEDIWTDIYEFNNGTINIQTLKNSKFDSDDLIATYYDYWSTNGPIFLYSLDRGINWSEYQVYGDNFHTFFEDFQFISQNSVIFHLSGDNSGRYLFSQIDSSLELIDSFPGEVIYYNDTDNNFFFTHENEIYLSEDKGLNFELYLSIFESPILDLFQPPFSDSLFIFTENNVFLYSNDIDLEVIFNTETNAIDDKSNNVNLLGDFYINNIYPNPFNAEFTIEINVQSPQILEIDLININGEFILRFEEEFYSKGSHTIHNALENLNSGIYFLRINGKNFNKSKKIVYLK
ncbi:MAG: T9SS type A sorting domain-containing protein [Candidatus Marinimicrobia bacterium]|nr:T9SS type A sorting domain-containing protein [Candidatus Neomarinimicrobiota bacterium]